MENFEQLGVFYLGRALDGETHAPTDQLILYDAKDLTTHAVCVGMTGSGKTGLCLDLLEEAAIDGIPAIAIDPKGDLGNLLLTFPKLSPQDFEPWIESAEATRNGQTVPEYAASTAERWRKGLADWGQTGERIQRFRDAVDITIYTPGSDAGLGLTVMRSFAVPPTAVMNDAELFRERVSSAAAGLLALLGIDADPLKSREQILLANLFDQSWRAGQDLDLGTLIRQIQSPPFERVGFLDLESYFPAKDRFALAIALNNLLASPGFAAWLTGEPLDIQKLLYTSAGQPRLSIISIAHLSEPERMFFVTILLNEMLAWVRQQAGTSSLRALLYMDEVFGYFPPTANPPSKLPMLTLLKQARAYGVGVVLATQNPVDLDYKGLANAGTWFLGRLQTERDKARMLDGLEGASATAGKSFDRSRMEKLLSELGNRAFLMNNVHEAGPVLMQSRWALSYLRGPLTRVQIAQLMASRKQAAGAGPQAAAAAFTASASDSGSSGGTRPLLPPELKEAFLPVRALPPADAKLTYRPGLIATARVHYTQASPPVDWTQDIELLIPGVEQLSTSPWDEAERVIDQAVELEPTPDASGSFASLPAELARVKTYTSLTTGAKDHVYRTERLLLFKATSLKQLSEPGEDEAAFRVRLSESLKEQRDLALEKLRVKYQPKLLALQEQIRKAEQQVVKQKSQASNQKWNTAMSFGSTILGALLGRKVATASNLSKVATSARQAGRMATEGQDVSLAEEDLATRQQRFADLEAEFKAEADELHQATNPDSIELEETQLAPKKVNISITRVQLVWTPWLVERSGRTNPAYQIG